MEQCIEGIVLGASQHASAQSERACCAPWRNVSSLPIRLSHRRTAVHEHLQLCCSTLKLWSLPSLSQLCAVQRASSAAPGRPLARPGGRETEARRASASCIGGHVSRSRERAAQRGSIAHAFPKRSAEQAPLVARSVTPPSPPTSLSEMMERGDDTARSTLWGPSVTATCTCTYLDPVPCLL